MRTLGRMGDHVTFDTIHTNADIVHAAYSKKSIQYKFAYHYPVAVVMSRPFSNGDSYKPSLPREQENKV